MLLSSTDDRSPRVCSRRQYQPISGLVRELDPQAAAKVTTAILRLELGNTSVIKWFSGLGELKIDWGPGYRVYLLKDGETLIVLFGGGTKATQTKDITKAKALINEYKLRKKALAASKPKPRKK